MAPAMALERTYNARPCIRNFRRPSPYTKPSFSEANKALVGDETEKALANVVLLSEIPTTYDRNQKTPSTQAISCCAGFRESARRSSESSSPPSATRSRANRKGADLQPTEVVGFQMINPATGEFITEVRPARLG